MTKLLFIKLLRDVQTTWGRIVMMIVAISLSLIVFSAMLYARVIFVSEMTSDYSATNPASARMTINPGVSPEQAETILTVAKAEAGVIDATMRSVLMVQIQGKMGSRRRSNSLLPLQMTQCGLLRSRLSKAVGRHPRMVFCWSDRRWNF